MAGMAPRQWRQWPGNGPNGGNPSVQTHTKKTYRKLGVHSRAEAVHEALQLRIIQL